MMPDWRYYASGSNIEGEIRGFDDIGHPVGFTIPDLQGDALAAAMSSSVPLFIDSGAFGEKAVDGDRLVTVRPITDEEWRARLDIMLRVARAHADVTVVAPDSIGDQVETLERLERYRRELALMSEAGARVLVAIPRGPLGRIGFWRKAVDVLRGWCDPVPAFPMKKAAATPRDLAAFARAVGPDDVHLLGLGPKSSRWRGCLEALGFAGCRRVTADSVMIIANVGRTNGPNGGPRALTAASDRAVAMLGRLDYIGDKTQVKRRLAIGLAFGKPIDHRDGGGEPDTLADLVLVGCVAGKVGSGPVPIRDLYRSTLWSLRRRYAESRGVAWGVVSAGLGVVPSDQLAHHYEARAQDLSGEARRQWVETSRASIRSMLWPDGRIQVARIEVIAGSAYVDLVRESVNGLPIGVSAPLAGRGIGDRQGWLKAARARAARREIRGQMELFG